MVAGAGAWIWTVKTLDWHRILTWPRRAWPSAGLPAAERLRLFRAARFAAAAAALVVFPPLALAGAPPGAILSLVLAALLPAVVAADLRRPGGLDRAAALHALIAAAVLTGGVLRGLPLASAALLLGLAALEGLVVARRGGRIAAAAVALAGLAAAFTAHAWGGVTAEIPGGGPLALAAALLALAGTAALLLGVAAVARRQALAAGSDHRLAARVETVMSETVMTIDSSGRVGHVSGNAWRVLGLPPEALAARGLLELTLVADRPALLTAIADSSAATARQRLRIRLRESAAAVQPRYRWAEIAIEPRGMEGLTVASLRDATADVANEESRRAAGRDAEAAKVSRAAFLTTVNHELRTPLNAIIGFSDILSNPESTPSEPARVREYAAIVKSAGQDLHRMILAMIDITRIDSGVYEFEAEDADLAALVESCVEAFRQEPEAAGETFALRCAAGEARAAVDPRAIRSALFQLLSNAAKYGEGKGVEVSLATVDGGFDIVVKDWGEGISGEKLAQLERNFARLDEGLSRERGGIGLGLALARGLMTLHGGRILIDSKPGRGTSVTLRLARDSARHDANVLRLGQAAEARRKPATTIRERKRA